MSVSIIEALRNVDYNLRNNGGIGLVLAKDQLHNATVLLGKGYDLYEKVEPLLEKYGSVENVPEKDELDPETIRDANRFQWLINCGVAWRGCYDKVWQEGEWLYAAQNARNQIDEAMKKDNKEINRTKCHRKTHVIACQTCQTWDMPEACHYCNCR